MVPKEPPKRQGLSDPAQEGYIHVHQPTLLHSYVDMYLSRLQYRLQDSRIAVNVSKHNAGIFAKTAKSIQNLQRLQLFWEPTHWTQRARQLGMTPDTQLS
jgi:hypothetical protein